jgi:hypothetical protein
MAAAPETAYASVVGGLGRDGKCLIGFRLNGHGRVRGSIYCCFAFLFNTFFHTNISYKFARKI